MKVFIKGPFQRRDGSVFARFFTGRGDQFAAIVLGLKSPEDMAKAAQSFADHIRAYKKDPNGYTGTY